MKDERTITLTIDPIGYVYIRQLFEIAEDFSDWNETNKEALEDIKDHILYWGETFVADADEVDDTESVTWFRNKLDEIESERNRPAHKGPWAYKSETVPADDDRAEEIEQAAIRLGLDGVTIDLDLNAGGYTTAAVITGPREQVDALLEATKDEEPATEIEQYAIELLGWAATRTLLGDSDLQEEAEIFDRLLEHAMEKVPDWYEEALDSNDTEKAAEIAEFAEIALGLYLDPADGPTGPERTEAQYLDTVVAAWREEHEGDEIEQLLQEQATRTNNSPDNEFTAGVFYGLAKALTATDFAGYATTEHEMTAAIHRAYGVAW